MATNIRRRKSAARLWLWVLGCAAPCGTSLAARAVSQANPYKEIATTNVFRLRANAPAPPAELPKPAPAKIILQGITTMPGCRRVLFKISLPATPPEPTREIAYVLGEGERAGEIEVLAIDEKAGTVTFRNHGLAQTLALAK